MLIPCSGEDMLHVYITLFYTFVIFIRILIIYIADHRFIPAVPLCSADQFFYQDK